MYAIKQLRRKKNISQTDLANEVGVSLRTIQLYERKNANIPIKNLTKIAEFFEMTIAELYLHEVNDFGESYIGRKPFIKHKSTFYPLEYGKYLIMAPLVLMEQNNGYIANLGAESPKKNPFQTGFIIDFLEEGPYTAFEITGDSMNDHTLDAIPNKAIVLGVKIDKHQFSKKRNGMFDKSYILISKNRIICKQITLYDEKQGTIHCRNLNKSPEYKDFELALDDILEVFRIVKKQV
ncbi:MULTISPECIES: LexA family transcriptional regulator [Flavobacteriaceae]|uniref:XRE family transcriptional regulator n=1 Tax=Flavobacteriaceae TaxID=49546 RepID=UPI0014932396|nr:MULTISPECIES: LexA family transcriptional regulator [Allomuricauda]MDC6366419.1 LexA family transcriptional regulator [Muricauda sp. AC10]